MFVHKARNPGLKPPNYSKVLSANGADGHPNTVLYFDQYKLIQSGLGQTQEKFISPNVKKNGFEGSVVKRSFNGAYKN